MTAPTPGNGHDRLKATLDLAARRAETIPDSHRTISKHKAAPTPGTPATQALTDAYLRGRLDQLWGWAKAGKNGGMYAMDVELADRFTDDVFRIVRDSVAAREAAARVEGRVEALRDAAAYFDSLHEEVGNIPWQPTTPMRILLDLAEIIEETAGVTR